MSHSVQSGIDNIQPIYSADGNLVMKMPVWGSYTYGPEGVVIRLRKQKGGYQISMSDLYLLRGDRDFWKYMVPY